MYYDHTGRYAYRYDRPPEEALIGLALPPSKPPHAHRSLAPARPAEDRLPSFMDLTPHAPATQYPANCGRCGTYGHAAIECPHHPSNVPATGPPAPRQSSGSRGRASGASRSRTGSHRARRDQPRVNPRIHPPRDADAGPAKHPIGAGPLSPVSTAASVIVGPGISSSLSGPPFGA
ncbi:MAG: hypothetical protein FD189_2570 [Elusimicrobia bacterium]|nr:MAG: hypothetical protein FD189_2570 [Elusimicrobiota bacterium]